MKARKVWSLSLFSMRRHDKYEFEIPQFYCIDRMGFYCDSSFDMPSLKLKLKDTNKKIKFLKIYDKAAETFLKTYLLHILWHITIYNDSIKSLERLLLAGAGDKTSSLSIAEEHFPFIILHFLPRC